MSEHKTQPEATGPARYGKYYWCVKSALSNDGEIYVHADNVRVTEQGDLVCSSSNSSGDQIVEVTGASGAFAAKRPCGPQG